MGFPHSNGCDICRKRKVKCDETRPTCKRCARAGKVCSGYSKRTLRWEVVKVLQQQPSGAEQTICNDKDANVHNPTCKCHGSKTPADKAGRSSDLILRESLPHPQDVLTTSQREPFQSLPIKVNSRVSELVSHYIIDIPRLFYNANSAQPIQNLYFPLSLIGPIAFQAIVMSIASSSMAKLRGIDESAESLQYRVSAVKAVRIGLSDPSTKSSDEILVAMVSFAEVENYYGLKAAASTHMKAIMATIRQRGGPIDIGRNHPKFPILLNWLDCLMAGPANFDDLTSWSTSPQMSRVWHYQSQALFELDEFVQFLERVKLQTRNQKAGLLEGKTILPAKLGQRLQETLSIPTNIQSWDAHHVSLYCRLAAMIHIYSALWEYRHLPQEYARYVANIGKAFSGISESAHLCPGAFTFYLFQTNTELSPNSTELSGLDETHSAAPQTPVHSRLWTVARILRVAKLLSKKSLMKVNHILLSHLCSSEQHDDGKALDADWVQGLKFEAKSCPSPYMSLCTIPIGSCPFGDIHQAT